MERKQIENVFGLAATATMYNKIKLRGVSMAWMNFPFCELPLNVTINRKQFLFKLCRLLSFMIAPTTFTQLSNCSCEKEIILLDS